MKIHEFVIVLFLLLFIGCQKHNEIEHAEIVKELEKYPCSETAKKNVEIMNNNQVNSEKGNRYVISLIEKKDMDVWYYICPENKPNKSYFQGASVLIYDENTCNRILIRQGGHEIHCRYH